MPILKIGTRSRSELSALPFHRHPPWRSRSGGHLCLQGWGAGGSPACAPLRNKDFQEVTLEKEGRILLHFAAAYGFRNIQNLVQKLKRGRCPYHYVEVMACPAGSCATGACSSTRAAGRVPPGQEGWKWSPVLCLTWVVRRLRRAGVGRGVLCPVCRCPLMTAFMRAPLCYRLLERRRPAQGLRHAQQGAAPARGNTVWHGEDGDARGRAWRPGTV